MKTIRTRDRPFRDRFVELLGGVWQWVLLALGMALAVYFILDGRLSNAPLIAVVLAVLVVGSVLTGSYPYAIALIAIPGLFVSERIGLGGGDLSVSDAALAAAFGTAVLLGIRPYSRPLRALLWLNLFYQFTTIFTVIVNPSVTNTVEWFHAWLLISGALISGWALGRAGLARVALATMVVSTMVIAVATYAAAIVSYSRGDFSAIYPTWPFEMQKNFAGSMLAFGALIVAINPAWIGWSKGRARQALIFLVGALLATQSRQAIIGLAVALIVVVVRRGVATHIALTLLIALPAGWLIVQTISEQVDSQNQFNSYYQRLDWLREVYALWKLSPIFGHGLRYWYTHPWANFQPPQAEAEILASAGVVGLIGFIVMWVGVIVVLWRIDPRYGTLAFAAVLSRIVAAQFDLFWVAAQVSIPFVIAGICLGSLARDADPAASSITTDLSRAHSWRTGRVGRVT